MDFLKEFLNQYAATILYTIVTAIAGFIGIAVKNVLKKYCDTRTKKEIAKTVVGAVEQLYKDLHGQEKYDKAVEAMSQMLADKGVTISEFEIKMLIEAAVAELNSSFIAIGELESESSNDKLNGKTVR